MPVRIITVGKRSDPWIDEGIKHYQKRLRKPFDLTWELIPNSTLDASRAPQEEAHAIQNRIHPDDYVVLLDENGSETSSVELSNLISEQLNRSKSVVLIIGGAYGLHSSLDNQSHQKVSLSRLTFPHQLVRLVLAEQIYRAQEIATGRPYHHE